MVYDKDIRELCISKEKIPYVKYTSGEKMSERKK